MATITLDELRDNLEQRYGPLVVPFSEGLRVVFTQPLRLPKDRRRQLLEMQKRRAEEEKVRAETTRIAESKDEQPVERDLDEAEEDTLGFLRAMLRLAATDVDACDLFLEEVGDDVLLLSTVMEAWTKETSPGDPSPSES